MPEKEEISEVEKNLKLTLDLLNSVNNLENLTPAQAADVLKVFQATQPVADTSTSSAVTTHGDEEFNMCPAWGCKRKFQVTTNGGKSNISSLWIHMQNAHKAAFVVFRRLKRQGYDKYCDKCQFWLKVG